MKLTPATADDPGLSAKERAALVKLLTDEDPAVHEVVRDKILSCGTSAAEWLQPHLLSSDPVLRRRVREIMERIERRLADDSFLSFCLHCGEDFDLERGVWLLAQTRHPEINVPAYEALLDSFAGMIRPTVPTRQSAASVLRPLNRILLTELGFRGNTEDPYDPEDCHLNRVVDRRLGSPLSLGLVYLFVARRLNLPMAGIALPGYFLCRFQSSKEEVYVDAFRGGRLRTKADCIAYLRRSGQEIKENVLLPATPRRLLLRLCATLHQIYLHLKRRDETNRLQHYLVALAK